MGQSPNAFALLVLLGWLPMVALMFAALPARRAVVIAYLAAWLFLPMVSYPCRAFLITRK
ncbi:MAG: hypothetical protein HC898_01100 [Phycisphaerales bacterium]|nr:hypothetical protein [Phycisphaerales bacterium]